MARCTIATFLIAAAVVPSVAIKAATVSGTATIIDGDALVITGNRVRLFAIDAPEITQTCDRNGGRWACSKATADELRSMIGNYPVSCAHRYVKKHQTDAPILAAMRADELRAGGDEDGARNFEAIVRREEA